ncbi:RluA family pseudouridine synthase [Malaciobacter sp. WC5094]
MPYILKKINVSKSMKIEEFLSKNTNLDKNTINSLVSKGKIFNDKNKRVQKNELVKEGYINVYVFEPQSRGLKPLFETFHFAIFDKPSGIKVHPSAIDSEYTLLDEIQFYLGKEASLVHRIDAQTSGLVLVSKNPYSQMVLNSMFEEKKYDKKYLAYVEGKIKESLNIDSKITNSKGLIKLKMVTSNKGKESLTKIKPIFYNQEKDITLIEAIPITGRQHQIRVHLDSIGHRIIGDPIYGIDEKICDKILKKSISQEEINDFTKAHRLMLHAYCLEFEFMNIKYKIVSKQDFKETIKRV